TALSLALRYAAEPRQSVLAAPDILNAPATALLKAQYAQDRESWAQDAFEVVQHVQGSAAATALRALGDRLIQNDPVASEFVRRRQDVLQEIRRLDADLISAISSDSRLENPQREAEIKQKLKVVNAVLQKMDAAHPPKLVEIDELGHPSPVKYDE